MAIKIRSMFQIIVVCVIIFILIGCQNLESLSISVTVLDFEMADHINVVPYSRGKPISTQKYMFKISETGEYEFTIRHVRWIDEIRWTLNGDSFVSFQVKRELDENGALVYVVLLREACRVEQIIPISKKKIRHIKIDVRKNEYCDDTLSPAKMPSNPRPN